jgi:hypothetical protein
MTATSERACACAHAGSPAPAAKRRAAPCCLALSLGLAALVPKCPMCFAAYLSLLGLGGGLAADAYPVLRPLLLALAVLAAVAVVLQWRAVLRRSASRRPLAAGEVAGAG